MIKTTGQAGSLAMCIDTHTDESKDEYHDTSNDKDKAITVAKAIPILRLIIRLFTRMILNARV